MTASSRQSPFDQALIKEIIDGTLTTWEPYHRKWMNKANHFYSLYRNYQDFKNAYNSSTTPRGQDSVMREAQGEYGVELFIPMSFSTVETILPAMLSQTPEMTALPRNQLSEGNAATVKAMLEAQQEQCEFPLKLQTVAKDGLITGTGIGKAYWRSDYRVKKQLQPHPETGYMQPMQVLQQLYDDPDFDAIDPFDFIIDPFCDRLQNADGAFHRAWRSTRYVMRMAETQQWRNLEHLTPDALRALGSGGEKYNEVWNTRRMLGDRGSVTGAATLGKDDIHEVLEFHDGDRVVTVLNRELVVASGENPSWHGEMPFMGYTPTENPHQFHGIGEIEPIEQLQEELNTLRTQRRYNADLVLQRVFAYHEGLVERDDIQFGPGYGIPVNGDPRELLFPIQIGDIPNSGYQEEQAIGADIDRTSGISDAIAGAGVGGETATGVQLVQSAASRRIEMKTRRLEKQVVNRAGHQFVELSQQHILANKTIRVPSPPQPGQPDRRWAWLPLSPPEIAGEFDIKVVENSMSPENIPQERADAQGLQTLFGQNPAIDQAKLTELALEKMGVKHPKTYLAPPAPTVPAEVLDRIAEKGVPQGLIAESLHQAGGPDLLGGAGAPGEGEQAAVAGPGAEPPSEGGPPVTGPPEPEPESEGSPA